jgi:hypothetical protein
LRESASSCDRDACEQRAGQTAVRLFATTV